MTGKARLHTSVLVVASLALASVGATQEYSYENGYIRFTEGDVSLQRAQNPEPEPGDINLPVLPGDRLWTAGGSFAEIGFADGTVLRVGESTKVDFMAFGSEPNLHLWNGSVVIIVPEGVRARIDTPSGSVYPQSAGSYRIDVGDDLSTTVSVLEGVAELASAQSLVVIRSGERSVLEPGASPEAPFAFDRSRADRFDLWSRERNRASAPPRRREVPLESQEEVPTEVDRYVDDLDAHGRWRHHDEHGSVWYPTVGVGWAPYRNGRWCYTSYGYTWVAHEPWGWAPFHYGRWGFDHHGWFWIPGRRWAPAWVSFAVGPVWIGWSPLGHHGGSVFGFHQFFRRPFRHHRKGHFFLGGRAVPRHVFDHGAGWNFSRKKHFRHGGRARLRAADIGPTAARARVFRRGAVLDHDLVPHATASKHGFAPRVRWRHPFAKRAVPRTTQTRPGARRARPRDLRGQADFRQRRRAVPRASAEPTAREPRRARPRTSVPTGRTARGASRTDRGSASTAVGSSSRVFRSRGATAPRRRSPDATTAPRRARPREGQRAISRGTTPFRSGSGSQPSTMRSRARTRTFAPDSPRRTGVRTRGQGVERRQPRSSRGALTPSRARSRGSTRATPSRRRAAPTRQRATPTRQRATPSRQRATPSRNRGSSRSGVTSSRSGSSSVNRSGRRVRSSSPRVSGSRSRAGVRGSRTRGARGRRR